MSHVKDMNNFVISFFALMDNSSVLAGVPRGEEAFARLIRMSNSLSGLTRVFLSFSGVDVATASFLRESVVNFRTFCREFKRDLYPVVANGNSNIMDELSALLELTGDALVSCHVNDLGEVSQVKIVGRLEQKQNIALQAVTEAGEAEAGSLAHRYKDVEATAWNNRLASLVGKGILVELRKGRAKSYRPVLEM